MRSFLLPAVTAGLFLCLGTACSSNGGSGTTGGPSCPADLAAAPGSAFCNGDMSTVDCSLVSVADHTQVCGVPLPSPAPIAPATTPPDLTRSSAVKEYAGSGPPDLSCFQMANWPKAGTSMPVTVSGIARIFAHGCASTNLTIEAWTVKRTNDSHDGELDQMVGKGVTTPADCTTTSMMDTTMDCMPRYQCNYSYPMVPSETELVFKTYGSTWAPLYDYNIYIPNSAVMNGTWTHNVRALDAGDYTVIAQAAIGAPISPGNAAVAGEVHDCGDVRLIGATVDVNVGRKLLTYFTTDESNPLPDLSATSTTALGLYSALDIAPGPVGVGALGYVNGALTTVGYYRVHAFADSVTSITFHGLTPPQIHP